MTEQQYLIKAIKQTGEVYVQDRSHLFDVACALEKEQRVSMHYQRSPVGAIWRVTHYQEVQK